MPGIHHPEHVNVHMYVPLLDNEGRTGWDVDMYPQLGHVHNFVASLLFACPFPGLMPPLPTDIFWHHFLYKLIALKSCVSGSPTPHQESKHVHGLPICVWLYVCDLGPDSYYRIFHHS